MRSPTALVVRPIPWHMSIHDRDYLWTAHGHSCLVIMAAVAPKSLLREAAAAAPPLAQLGELWEIKLLNSVS